ncbi:MAG: ATP-binding protein [Clostridia bacterium]|nr:ATP-binding protein [Clostridia bacterium]
MAYNKENYRRIRAAYQTKYLKAYEEAERRMEELHQKSPAIAEIDRKLAATGAEIALAALGTGGSYREKLAEVEKKNRALQEKREALLEELGYPADYTLPPYECPYCHDSGFVDTKMCECMRRELVLAAYDSSGLGELMRTQSFETFSPDYYAADPAESATMRKNFELLRDYAEGFGPGADSLILCGATGLGKTHLSTAVARRVIERGYDVYYTGAIAMFADFEHARFGTGLGEQAVDPARYVDCDLLILDDLGTEVTNQFTNSCLYMILDNRINLHRPTIINTNLTGKEIKARYTDRIASRILGGFNPLLFTGTDVRRQKLTKK